LVPVGWGSIRDVDDCESEKTLKLDENGFVGGKYTDGDAGVADDAERKVGVRRGKTGVEQSVTSSHQRAAAVAVKSMTIAPGLFDYTGVAAIQVLSAD
jgi:hypothetical protein